MKSLAPHPACDTRRRALLLAASGSLLLLGGCPSSVSQQGHTATPAARSADGRFVVAFEDEDQFTEFTRQPFARTSRDRSWLAALQNHLLRQFETKLPPDQSLGVVITDIRLAGREEPMMSQGADVRIVRDIYPPRITLRFRLTKTDDSAVVEGFRNLSQPDFLIRPNLYNDSDPLRYEKSMLDAWVQREFLE